MELAGFIQDSFSENGQSRVIYRKGQGPGVILLHEVPGITPETITLANRIVEAGFTVVMPVLFGTPGKPMKMSDVFGQMARLCIRREIHLLAASHTSPLTTWLRGLSRFVHESVGGAGIGVVGMCLTGNFALSMMLEPSILAPVLSQPALPLPINQECRRALHISRDDLNQIKKRIQKNQLSLLGLRFTEDRKCPPERFQTLRQEFAHAFEAVEIDSGPDNLDGISQKSHSVLTFDFVDKEGHPTHAAMQKVLHFLQHRLHVGTYAKLTEIKPQYPTSEEYSRKKKLPQ